MHVRLSSLIRQTTKFMSAFIYRHTVPYAALSSTHRISQPIRTYMRQQYYQDIRQVRTVVTVDFEYFVQNLTQYKHKLPEMLVRRARVWACLSQTYNTGNSAAENTHTAVWHRYTHTVLTTCKAVGARQRVLHVQYYWQYCNADIMTCSSNG